MKQVFSFLFSIICSFSLIAQTSFSSHHSLDWDESPRMFSVGTENSEQSLFFKGATYDCLLYTSDAADE